MARKFKIDTFIVTVRQGSVLSPVVTCELLF